MPLSGRKLTGFLTVVLTGLLSLLVSPTAAATRETAGTQRHTVGNGRHAIHPRRRMRQNPRRFRMRHRLKRQRMKKQNMKKRWRKVVSRPYSAQERACETLFWQQQASMTAVREGLPPWLFLRLIARESRFRPAARSPKGAIGLCQLMPGTARILGVNPCHPEDNLRGGARYLRQMLERFEGNVPAALAAYNAGPGAVDRAMRRSQPEYVPEHVVARLTRHRNSSRYHNIPAGYSAGTRHFRLGYDRLPLPPYRETRQYVQHILSGTGLAPAVSPAVSLAPPTHVPVRQARPQDENPADGSKDFFWTRDVSTGKSTGGSGRAGKSFRRVGTLTLDGRGSWTFFSAEPDQKTTPEKVPLEPQPRP